MHLVQREQLDTSCGRYQARRPKFIPYGRVSKGSPKCHKLSETHIRCRSADILRLFSQALWVRQSNLRGPGVSEHRHTPVPAPDMASVLSHMGFSRRRSVLRPLFRTPHGLLGYQRSSACFDQSVCHLYVYHFSVDLIGGPTRLPALLFPISLPPLDTLDSELWYRSGCRAAALASSSTLAVGQPFWRLFTTRSALQG
jgi:hypothetical protein